MGIIVGLLTFYFAFTHERFWPRGAYWIAGVSAVSVVIGFFLLQMNSNYRGVTFANIPPLAWLTAWLLQVAITGFFYGLGRATRWAWMRWQIRKAESAD
jgi:hypothetical protein